MRKFRLETVLFMSALILVAGCASSNKLKGGVIGAGAGSIIGGIIGKQTGNTTTGAIIGAAVGGTAGALIGRNMDKQAEEMKKNVENAKVERVGEGIKLTFDSGILFKTNSSALQPASRTSVEELAEILKKYPDTNILIEGHTDSDGTDEYNMKLSEKRAQSVADYLKSLGIGSSRLAMKGYGESQPVASNDTPEGKQANRRVEVAVTANDKMKQDAQEGKLN